MRFLLKLSKRVATCVIWVPFLGSVMLLTFVALRIWGVPIILSLGRIREGSSSLKNGWIGLWLMMLSWTCSLLSRSTIWSGIRRIIIPSLCMLIRRLEFG